MTFFTFYSMLQLIPTEGMVRKNNHLKIGRYHQHLHELLDMDVSPIAYMMKQFPEELKEIDAVRKIIGRYGITGKAQVCIYIWVGTIGTGGIGYRGHTQGLSIYSNIY